MIGREHGTERQKTLSCLANGVKVADAIPERRHGLVSRCQCIQVLAQRWPQRWKPATKLTWQDESQTKAPFYTRLSMSAWTASPTAYVLPSSSATLVDIIGGQPVCSEG